MCFMKLLLTTSWFTRCTLNSEVRRIDDSMTLFANNKWKQHYTKLPSDIRKMIPEHFQDTSDDSLDDVMGEIKRNYDVMYTKIEKQKQQILPLILTSINASYSDLLDNIAERAWKTARDMGTPVVCQFNTYYIVAYPEDSSSRMASDRWLQHKDDIKTYDIYDEWINTGNIKYVLEDMQKLRKDFTKFTMCSKNTRDKNVYLFVMDLSSSNSRSVATEKIFHSRDALRFVVVDKSTNLEKETYDDKFWSDNAMEQTKYFSDRYCSIFFSKMWEEVIESSKKLKVEDVM